MNPVYTIGHSNLSIEKFISLLQVNNITMVIDVRSVPFSRFYPQFNKDRLAESLKLNEILYIFEGDRLGGRIKDKDCFLDKQLPQRKTNIAELVDYEVLIRKDWFRQGINNIIESSKQHSVSILCSEEQPLRCHRNLLISRYLFSLGYKVFHIRSNGNPEEFSVAPQQEQLKLF